MVAGSMLSSRGSKSCNVGGTWRFGTPGKHGHLAGLEGLVCWGRGEGPILRSSWMHREGLICEAGLTSGKGNGVWLWTLRSWTSGLSLFFLN